MADTVLSVCLTTYKQPRLVKTFLDDFAQIACSEVELVINDDSPSLEFDTLVKSYDDPRMKYFHNETQQGHDGNILQVLKRASGKYALLMRTRDRLVIENMPKLVDLLREGTAGYLIGSAFDENGKARLSYRDHTAKHGMEAIRLNYRLMTHPSGQIYNLKLIDLDVLTDFYNEELRHDKHSFVLHSLIRVYLAERGDLRTLELPYWIYTYTEKSQDTAVNSTAMGTSVYEPGLCRQRFIYEADWVCQHISPSLRECCFNKMLPVHLDACTWSSKLNCEDAASARHYASRPKKISIALCYKDFIATVEASRAFVQGMAKGSPTLLRLSCAFYTPYMASRYIARKALGHGSLRMAMSRIYNQVRSRA